MAPRLEDLGLIMHAWARVDPESALAQGVAWRRSGVKWMAGAPDHAVNEVVYVWAQDPGADVQRAVADLPSALRGGATVAMIRAGPSRDRS